MSFEENIKKWSKLDDSIKELNNKIKDLKKEKDFVSNDILTYVNNNNLEKATIIINDSKLKFSHLNCYEPLSYKFLSKCFLEFFRGWDGDVEIIEALLNFIKSKRTY